MKMTVNSKFVDVKGIMEMFCVGRSKAIQIGEESHSKVKIGRSARYSIEKLNIYMESLQNN